MNTVSDQRESDIIVTLMTNLNLYETALVPFMQMELSSDDDDDDYLPDDDESMLPD